MATTTTKETIGSAVTAIAGTAFNALASGAYALGSALDWTQSHDGDGYPLINLELTFKLGTSTSVPCASFEVWILKSVDGGGTYEDSSAAPCRPPDYQFIARTFGGGTGDANQHLVSGVIDMPVGHVKFLVRNGTAVACSSSNTDSVLKATPISIQQV